MARRYFAEVIQNGEFDIASEYSKLHRLFFSANGALNLYDECKECFLNYPFRGTCLSLDEFNTKNSFNYYSNSCTGDETLEDLVNFMEYSYNLVSIIDATNYHYGMMAQLYNSQISNVESEIGYMHIFDETSQTYIFVPISEAAIAVSEIIDSKLAFKVIQYNHHSMKGDLSRKKDTLYKLYLLLEAKKNELITTNHSLQKDVFSLFNNLNIRHNNQNPDSGAYNQYVANMTDDELEQWYDDTYQLSLLCILEMDNVERRRKVRELNQRIKETKQEQ